jgi:hypothetical protein
VEAPAVAALTESTKYNLRRYNKRRHELLVKLPVINEPRDVDYDAHMKVMDAVRVSVHWLTGNLSVSLFWEDIIHLLIRINQLYALLFLAYYETWPSRYRGNMTWWFSIWIWDWNILS